MSKTIKTLEDWLLYWGAKDERVRAETNKAGYVAFMFWMLGYLCYLLPALFFANAAARPFVMCSAIPFYAALVVLLILMWRKGLTYDDTDRQKKAITKLVVACIPLFFVVAIVSSSSLNMPPMVFWICVGVSTLLGPVFSWVLIRLLYRANRRRAEKMASMANEPHNQS